MLQRGIEDYVRAARQRYEHDSEDAVEYLLCTITALNEAKRLRAWYSQVAPEYLQSSIEQVDALLKELASDKERFEALVREQNL